MDENKMNEATVAEEKTESTKATILDLKCPNCNSPIHLGENEKRATCPSCNSELLIDDGVLHIQYDNARQAGYDFEKGRQDAIKEAEEAEVAEAEEAAEDTAAEVTETAKEEAPQKEAPKKKNAAKEIVDFCLPIVIALIVAMLLKTFVFANAQVPTGSMLNTIHEGDRVIASRIEYHLHDPERYDVIIFKFPDDVAEHEIDPSVKVEYFVKRIIGLPGETVEIVNGVVYVTDKDGNTEQLDDSFVTACTPTGNFGPYEVPEDSYFVMGDNRESSIDSRYWTTTNYVKRELIIGKVKFRYYPNFGKLDGPAEE